MRALWLILFFISFSAATPMAETAPVPGQPHKDLYAEPVWAELEPQLARLDPDLFYACARNALYAFLHLSGRQEVTFEQVKAAVPLTAPYGTSLKSLLDAANNLGFDAQVRLYKLPDFASVPLPAIVHVSNGPSVGTSHYDVMYKIDDEWVYLVDGTTARPYKTRHARFIEGDWWTGYALIRKPSLLGLISDQWSPTMTYALLAIYIPLIVIGGLRLRRRRLVVGKTADCVTLFLLMLFSLHFATTATAAETTSDVWRTPKNQGINALFCYLRAHDVPCEYSDLVKEQTAETQVAPLSGKTLVNLATRHGMPLRVASLTMKEFLSCERPLITYMTSDTPDDGAFLLVMNSTDDEVFYIDGASAAIQSISMENFRRVWSGIALVKTDKQIPNWMLFGCSSVVVLMVCAGIQWRLGKTRKSSS